MTFRRTDNVSTDQPEGIPLVRRFFTTPGADPYDALEWETRDAVILGTDGAAVFEQKDVHFPTSWSQHATNVVASKYFRGPMDGSAPRERSVARLIDRVVAAISAWGEDGKYFADTSEQETFESELAHILVNQLACFNSPVWFNVGVSPKPQCSACFIIGVEDDMDSILEWYRTEGNIFKWGSGSGANLSRLRSSMESVTGGGKASGPVSFMRGADAIAGTIKSGGRTRRSAKMVVLDISHPDIEEFISCKVQEEKKALALGEAGFDISLDGEAAINIQYQNANNSVRVSDDFMRAVENNGDWQTRYVLTGEAAKTYRARELMRHISTAAWECADPGVQYDTTINDWHTFPDSGRINASNPCAEFLSADNSACNLASINLLKFLREEGSFDVEAYRHTCTVMILAQEIIVSNSSYPTEKIAKNAEDFRQLGLGYSNLGALLMTLGAPYDSDEGRSWASFLSAIMTGQAYLTSASIASRIGPFDGFEVNKESMYRVIQRHCEAVRGLASGGIPSLAVAAAAKESWNEALRLGRLHGYRNSVVTCIAPTGTISFMMDCDTTGIEPDLALVKYKTLVGGGLMKIVNSSVPASLRRLGYDEEQASSILQHLNTQDTIEDAPGLLERDLPVFDCAFKSQKGSRTIHWLGHIKMMAAVQPFISMGISKTINMPEDTTVEEVEKAYIEGWKRGLKALAIYRDGSKHTQVLSTKQAPYHSPEFSPIRHRLPTTRDSITHKFSVQGHEGYITAGCYEDGTPGEIFVTMAKEGSTLSGMLDAFATSISLTLQFGVPLHDLVQKFSYMRFEPSGRTENSEIPVAQSIVDYIFRWLASTFLSEEEKEEFGVLSPAVKAKLENGDYIPPNGHSDSQADAPPCADCGWIMSRAGPCYRCDNCGSTTGCG